MINETTLLIRFASNGWLDWLCEKCDKVIHNNDVHVNLDWKYCPYCGCHFKDRKHLKEE